MTFKRIVRSGFNNFKRNSWLSFATITIMFLALFVIEGVFIFSVLTDHAISTLQDKIDISVYFKKETPENEILLVQERLIVLEEVRSVEYISENEALSRFKTRHADNPILLESLSELDDNPLQASLNIKAKVPDQYASIAAFLERGDFNNLIEKINYFQNKDVIERLSRITLTLRNSGIGLSLVLALIAMLVAFNSIRMAIYTSREEIGIMRLVGGAQGFVRGPYLIEGLLYGLCAALVAVAVFYPVTIFLSPKVAVLLPEINLSQYYLNNIFQISITLIGIGVMLGVLSSAIAIRRYLKI